MHRRQTPKEKNNGLIIMSDNREAEDAINII